MRAWLKEHGPEWTAGRFRLLGWPAERANGKEFVVDLRQLVGGKRWSLTLARVIEEPES